MLIIIFFPQTAIILVPRILRPLLVPLGYTLPVVPLPSISTLRLRRNVPAGGQKGRSHLSNPILVSRRRGFRRGRDADDSDEGSDDGFDAEKYRLVQSRPWKGRLVGCLKVKAVNGGSGEGDQGKGVGKEMNGNGKEDGKDGDGPAFSSLELGKANGRSPKSVRVLEPSKRSLENLRRIMRGEVSPPPKPKSDGDDDDVWQDLPPSAPSTVSQGLGLQLLTPPGQQAATAGTDPSETESKPAEDEVFDPSIIMVSGWRRTPPTGSKARRRIKLAQAAARARTAGIIFPGSSYAPALEAEAVSKVSSVAEKDGAPEAGLGPRGKPGSTGSAGVQGWWEYFMSSQSLPLPAADSKDGEGKDGGKEASMAAPLLPSRGSSLPASRPSSPKPRSQRWLARSPSKVAHRTGSRGLSSPNSSPRIGSPTSTTSPPSSPKMWPTRPQRPPPPPPTTTDTDEVTAGSASPVVALTPLPLLLPLEETLSPTLSLGTPFGIVDHNAQTRAIPYLPGERPVATSATTSKPEQTERVNGDYPSSNPNTQPHTPERQPPSQNETRKTDSKSPAPSSPRRRFGLRASPSLDSLKPRSTPSPPPPPGSPGIKSVRTSSDSGTPSPPPSPGRISGILNGVRNRRTSLLSREVDMETEKDRKKEAKKETSSSLSPSSTSTSLVGTGKPKFGFFKDTFNLRHSTPATQIPTIIASEARPSLSPIAPLRSNDQTFVPSLASRRGHSDVGFSKVAIGGYEKGNSEVGKTSPVLEQSKIPRRASSQSLGGRTVPPSPTSGSSRSPPGIYEDSLVSPTSSEFLRTSMDSMGVQDILDILTDLRGKDGEVELLTSIEPPFSEPSLSPLPSRTPPRSYSPSAKSSIPIPVRERDRRSPSRLETRDVDPQNERNERYTTGRVVGSGPRWSSSDTGLEQQLSIPPRSTSSRNVNGRNESGPMSIFGNRRQGEISVGGAGPARK